MAGNDTFTGRELDELLTRLDPKSLKRGLRGGYRKAGNAAVKIARQRVATCGLHVVGSMADLKKGVRLFVYGRGGGFMVTVKGRARGNKSMHTTRTGKMKPVLMWAEDGTMPRNVGRRVLGKRRGGSRGAMPAYHILRESREPMFRVVEASLRPDLEKSLQRQAAKAGFV